jgi:hypothetical protein
MPLVCHGCGEKVTMKRGALWLDTWLRQTWHPGCKIDALEAARPADKAQSST